MVDTSQIAALLFQVRSATSPVAKVRAVMQAWQVIRAMSPYDRKKVAMELGFDGAEGLVDRVAAEHGGLPPDQLKDALRAAGSSDPDDVERLVGQLRDPTTRKGAVQRGIEKLEHLLTLGTTEGAGAAAGSHASETEASPDGGDGDEDTGTGTAAGGGDKSAAETLEPTAEQPSSPPPPPAAPRPATPAATATATEPAGATQETAGGDESTAASGQRPVRVPGSRRPAESRASRTASATAPVSPVSVQPAARRAPQPSPPAANDDVWASLQRRRAAAQPEVVAAPEPLPVVAVERTPGIVARLRELRADPEETRRASTAELRAAVERCGPEWARRRAVLALIEVGALADSALAVELIGGLSSRAARRWCLKAFARARSLGEEERTRLTTALNL